MSMRRVDASCKTRESRLRMGTKEARMKTKEEGLLATLAVLGIAALVAYLFPDHSLPAVGPRAYLTRRCHRVKFWSLVEVVMPYLRLAFRERAGKISCGGPTIR